MRYPCPCCGYIVFTQPPGTQERCPVCGWIDDAMQLQFPAYGPGNNGVSLLDAQRNFAEFGAKNSDALPSVRFTNRDDKRDPQWRVLDVDRDTIRSVPNDFDGMEPPQDTRQLYYWRSNV